MFGVVFPEDSDVSLDDMKDVLNSLQRTDIAIQITCNPTDQAYQALQIPVRLSQWGLCDGGITDQQVLDYLKSYPGKDKIIQAKRDSYTTADEEYDVTRRILSIVREVLAKNKGTHINLAGLHFQWGDFTGIDFSEIDLTDTFFERCNFTGAVFDSTKYRNFNPNNSNWWDAAKIDKDLLEIFTSKYYPGYFEREILLAGKDFNQEYYIDRIAQLCRIAGLNCGDRELKFVSQNFTVEKIEN